MKQKIITILECICFAFIIGVAIYNIACNTSFFEVSIAQLLTPFIATVYKGNIIKNLIMDCQSYTKYRPNETTGGIFVSWLRKEELPTGA